MAVNILQSFANSPAPAVVRHEVAFIDSSITDYQSLLAGIRPGVEVVLLDAAQDGLAQMAAWAQSHTGFDAIHVLSHGAESQLLDHTYRARSDLELHLPWSVIPAACGLREVDYGPEEGSLYRLGSFFGQDDLVLVYADAQALALLLATTHCTPLLVLSESKNSLLTSYTALKRLTQHGHLSPVIANIGAHRQSRGAKRQNHMVMNLLECARNFLGFQGWVFNITAPERAAPEANDVRRLALGLLETAVALRPLPIAGASTGTIGTLSSLRNH
jgi:hypothetical protein